MPVIGVRNSWLMLARNWLFNLAVASDDFSQAKRLGCFFSRRSALAASSAIRSASAASFFTRSVSSANSFALASSALLGDVNQCNAALLS